MKQIDYVLWQEDRWFIAKALGIEVVSQGRTTKKAVTNPREALENYILNDKRNKNT